MPTCGEAGVGAGGGYLLGLELKCESVQLGLLDSSPGYVAV